jgi:hypothetical protein
MTVAVGQQFDRLTVAGIVPAAFRNNEAGIQVECSCGSPAKLVRKYDLTSGNTRSCGCLRREMARAVLLARPGTDPPLPAEMTGARPTAAAVLALLGTAGGKGMLTSDIYRQFGEPASRSRRNRAVNTLLSSAERSGRARRSGEPERSPYYRGSPVYRWFITDAGLAKLSRPAAAERNQARRRDAMQRRDAALAWVREQSLGPGTPRDIRDRAVGELTAAGVISMTIGEIFGISGARVRQIRQETLVPHCATCACK